MSRQPYINVHLPPPGFIPDPTSSKSSFSAPGFTLPDHGFQSIYYPQGNHYFVPQTYAVPLQAPQYFPYNSAQYPPPFMASPPYYPYQMEGTEMSACSSQFNDNALSAPNNGGVEEDERRYSNATDKTHVADNVPRNSHTYAEASVRQKQQYGQQQRQQRFKRQEQKQHEEERQTWLQQPQSWRQQQEKWKPDQQHNQDMRGIKQEIQKPHQRGYQQYKQSETNQGLHPPKVFSQSRTYTNTKINSKPFPVARSIPPVTKHTQGTGRTVHSDCNNTEGENNIAKPHTSHAGLRHVADATIQPSYSTIQSADATIQSPLDYTSSKRGDGKHNNIRGSQVTESSNPITEFTDLKLNEVDVILDQYHSDLYAEIGRRGCDMTTLTTPTGFGLLYAGSKANVGVRKGRVFFEAKVTQNLLSMNSVSKNESHPNVARVGWSEENASLELGEESMSFGYGSSGKFSTNDIYRDYGESFTVNDVVGALIDLDSKPATVSFMKNGKHLGTAESVSAHCVDGNQLVVMYPHIYIKNCKISVNFGQEKPWFSPPEGYRYIGHLQSSERVTSLKPHPRKQREIIMIVGLPGAGKSTWAKKQQKDNPGKRYYILGTDQLLEKMRVTDMPRSWYNERFDKLYPLASKCFDIILDMAARSDRNCILDQTNVVQRARERKMSIFSGFYKIAVVIQPSNQELERRAQERTEKLGKRVPLERVLEMKGKYSLPSRPTFQEIKYAELDEGQVRALVKQYNGCRY